MGVLECMALIVLLAFSLPIVRTVLGLVCVVLALVEPERESDLEHGDIAHAGRGLVVADGVPIAIAELTGPSGTPAANRSTV